MLKTFKLLPPMIWVVAALFMFPYFMPNANSLPLFGVRLVTTLVLLVIALAAFRLRVEPHMSATRVAVHSLTALAVVGVSLAVAGKGTGMIALSHIYKLEGKYQDPKGTTLEFLDNNMAIMTQDGIQAVFSWQRLDNERFQLKPNSVVAFLGSMEAQVCNYRFPDSRSLLVSGCPLMRKVRLTRL